MYELERLLILGKEVILYTRNLWSSRFLQIPALTSFTIIYICYVVVGKLFYLSVLHFPHLKKYFLIGFV